MRAVYRLWLCPTPAPYHKGFVAEAMQLLSNAKQGELFTGRDCA